jgi:hypothetical protein
MLESSNLGRIRGETAKAAQFLIESQEDPDYWLPKLIQS